MSKDCEDSEIMSDIKEDAVRIRKQIYSYFQGNTNTDMNKNLTISVFKILHKLIDDYEYFKEEIREDIKNIERKLE